MHFGVGVCVCVCVRESLCMCLGVWLTVNANVSSSNVRRSAQRAAQHNCNQDEFGTALSQCEITSGNTVSATTDEKRHDLIVFPACALT